MWRSRRHLPKPRDPEIRGKDPQIHDLPYMGAELKLRPASISLETASIAIHNRIGIGWIVTHPHCIAVWDSIHPYWNRATASARLHVNILHVSLKEEAGINMSADGMEGVIPDDLDGGVRSWSQTGIMRR